MTIPLLTGGSVSVGKQIESKKLGTWFKKVQLQGDGVEIKQPILKGAGIKVSTAPIVIARLESQMSEALAKMNVIRILCNKEYYDDKYTEFWSAQTYLRSRHSRI